MLKNIIFASVGVLSAIIISLPLLIAGLKNTEKSKTAYILNYCVFIVLNALLWCLCSFMENSIVFECATAVMLTVLLLVASYDIKNRLVPRPLLILSGIIGIIVLFSDSVLPWYYHLIGGVSAFLIFLFIRFVATKIEKQEALGMADVILATAMALALGVWKMILAFLLASIIGVIVVLICRIVKKYGKKYEYAFTPMLTVGFAVAMIFGDYILNWYLALLGVSV